LIFDHFITVWISFTSKSIQQYNFLHFSPVRGNTAFMRLRSSFDRDPSRSTLECKPGPKSVLLGGQIRSNKFIRIECFYHY
jgi:hypothetical protein